MNIMSAISLLFLLAAIILGFFKKLNVGLIAMGLSMILGRIGGVADKTIIAGFSASIFVSIMGITFWFAVINQTGVVDLICKKGVALAGKHQWLIPFFLMALGFIVSYVGPGAVPATIVCVLSIPLAFEVGVNPLLYALPAFAGICAGRISPFTPEGAWTAELGIEQGYPNLTSYITVCGIVSALCISLVCFVFYKGWKRTGVDIKMQDVPKFNREQWMCIASIVLMIILVVFLNVTTALACLFLGVALLVLGVGTEKEALRTMPWGTMILVGGVGLLMVVIDAMGGIQLLSDLLASVMSARTAASIMGTTAGMMSWFSSSFGVVMPTLMPTVPGLLENLGTTMSGAPVLTAIAYGASIAGFSPFSSGGSMCLSAMSVDARFDESLTNKYFMAFFGWAIAALAIMALLALIGVYNWIAIAML